MWCVAVAGRAQTNATCWHEVKLDVAGVTRTALIYAPATATTNPTPVVFVFHGHGGSVRQVAKSFAIDRLWPEAISVYPQGLKTPGRLVDAEGKFSGWQHNAGDLGDRDLKFFDALLARVEQDYLVDPKRIFATGHSNGGAFTYLLWATRPEVFAAFAPSAAAGLRYYPGQLKPKPALHVAGAKDPLVKFAWQEETIRTVRQINGSDETGQPWNQLCTLYPSKTGTPLVTLIHRGKHEFPASTPPLIVKFFKER